MENEGKGDRRRKGRDRGWREETRGRQKRRERRDNKRRLIGKDRIEMCWKRGVTKRYLG